MRIFHRAFWQSIRTMITAAFSVIALVVISMVAFSQWQLSQMPALSRWVISSSAQMDNLQHLALAMASLDANLERFLLVRGIEYQEIVQGNLDELTTALTRLESNPASGTLGRLAELDDGIARLQDEVQSIFDAIMTNDSDGEVNRRVVRAYDDINSLKQIVDELSAEVLANLQRTAAEQDGLASAVVIRSAVLGGVAFLVALLTAIITVRRLRVISSLTDAATAIAAGDLNRSLPSIRSQSEIGILAAAFSAMTERLRQIVATLDARVTERTRDLALAAEIGRHITQVRDLDELLKQAVNLIQERFDLYYVQIYLTDPTGRTLIHRAGTGDVGAALQRRGHRLPVGVGSINGQAAAERRAVVVTDIRQSASFRPNPLLPETRAEMAVPLLMGEQVVGVLDLQSRQVGALSEDNLPAFQALAGQLAVAIQNASLLEQTELARRQAEAQVRSQVAKSWEDFLDAVERGERIGFAYDQQSLIRLDQAVTSSPDEQWLSVPLQVAEQTIGTVQLSRADRTPWSSDEMEIVAEVAARASRQLDNLRLIEQAEQYRREAEAAARRLSRQGWQEYLEKSKEMAFAYDQVQVSPLSEVQLATEQAYLQQVKVGDALVGQIAFEGVERLDPETEELVNAVVSALGDQLENLRLTQQTYQALAETEQLYTASAQIVQANTVHDVLKVIIENTPLRRFERASVMIFDHPWGEHKPEMGTMIAAWERSGARPSVPLGTTLPLDRVILARQARREYPTFVRLTPNAFDMTPEEFAQARQTGTNVAVFPMVVGDQWIGWLSAASNEDVELSDEELRQIGTLTGQAATVIQSIRLLEEAQTRARREQILREVTTRVRAFVEPEAILRTVARELGEKLGRKVIVQLGNPASASQSEDADSQR